MTASLTIACIHLPPLRRHSPAISGTGLIPLQALANVLVVWQDCLLYELPTPLNFSPGTSQGRTLLRMTAAGFLVVIGLDLVGWRQVIFREGTSSRGTTLNRIIASIMVTLIRVAKIEDT